MIPYNHVRDKLVELAFDRARRSGPRARCTAVAACREHVDGDGQRDPGGVRRPPRSARSQSQPGEPARRTCVDFGPVNQTRAAEHLGQGRAVTGTQVDRLESLGCSSGDPIRTIGASGSWRSPAQDGSSPNRSPTSTRCCAASFETASRAPTARPSPGCSSACSAISTDPPGPTDPSPPPPVEPHPPPAGSPFMTNAVIVDAVRTPGGTSQRQAQGLASGRSRRPRAQGARRSATGSTRRSSTT